MIVAGGCGDLNGGNEAGLVKVISIVHGCEQYLVSRFNREIVWQLDSKADSIAATLLSLCS